MDKYAIITGVSSGIGECIAKNFIKDNILSIINAGNVYLPYLPQSIASIITKLLVQILLGLTFDSCLKFLLLHQSFRYHATILPIQFD